MFNAHASTLNFLQINEISERKHGGISTGIYNSSNNYCSVTGNKKREYMFMKVEFAGDEDIHSG